MHTVLIRDEHTGRSDHSSITLEFPTELITIRELIRERVYQEVMDYNRRKDGMFSGLMQPSDSTVTPHVAGKRAAYALKPGREIDWKQQFEKACDAFTSNRVLIIVGDKQASELDEQVSLGRGVEVRFLKLVPLVGG